MEGLFFAILALTFAVLYLAEKDAWFKLTWLSASILLALSAAIYNSSLCSTAYDSITGITTYDYCTTTFQSGGWPTWLLGSIAGIILITLLYRLIRIAIEAPKNAK